MPVLKYDTTFLGYMRLFKSVTGADAKDCFMFNETLVFITEKGQTGLAIGKQGTNIKALKKGLKKNVIILETANTPEDLVKHFVFPLTPESVLKNGNKINVKLKTSGERRMILSNNLEKLKQLKFIVNRYFPDIEDIIILQ